MSVDVAVLGAGMVGAAVARSLAVAGLAVTVLDRGAAVGETSSSGEGNLLVSDKAPGPELLLAQYADRLWRRLVADLSQELGTSFPTLEYERKGGVVVATTQAAVGPLLRFASEQRDAGVDARAIDISQAIQLEPELNPAIHGAVHYPQDAQLQPLVAAEALLASARRYGASVRTNVEVTGALLDRAGQLTGVRTSVGPIPCGAVVVAAGPWSGELAKRLGVSLPVRPRRGTVLVTSRLPHRIFHKVYDADYVGAVESGGDDLQTSSVVESTASGTVLIGSSRQQVGFDARMQVHVLHELAAKALVVFPFLGEASVMRAYGGFRPYMPDHLPVVGADPRLPGLWFATGHEGAGIGLAPATGALVRDLMLGCETALDPAPFSLSRPSLAPHLAKAA